MRRRSSSLSHVGLEERHLGSRGHDAAAHDRRERRKGTGRYLGEIGIRIPLTSGPGRAMTAGSTRRETPGEGSSVRCPMRRAPSRRSGQWGARTSLGRASRRRSDGWRGGSPTSGSRRGCRSRRTAAGRRSLLHRRRRGRRQAARSDHSEGSSTRRRSRRPQPARRSSGGGIGSRDAELQASGHVSSRRAAAIPGSQLRSLRPHRGPTGRAARTTDQRSRQQRMPMFWAPELRVQFRSPTHSSSFAVESKAPPIVWQNAVAPPVPHASVHSQTLPLMS